MNNHSSVRIIIITAIVLLACGAALIVGIYSMGSPASPVYQTGGSMKVWIPLIVATMVIITLAVLVMLLFLYVWKAESRSRTVLQNTLVAVFSTLFLFLAVDLFFGMFVVHSDGWLFTLSNQRWVQRYWTPMNSEGYRDHEHEWRENLLFVVGDSVIAGHGINHIDDRLAGILANKLDASWTVAILARNGWHPASEYEALAKHAQIPKKLIVSYYINDIENAARTNGLDKPGARIKPAWIIQPFVDNSFAINWFYWRLIRKMTYGYAGSYWDYLYEAYDNPKVWAAHKAELYNFINYARQNDTEILFLVWPGLKEMDNSIKVTSKVVDYLAEQNVPVLDLTTYFLGRDPEDLVVNQMDSHPNEQANKEVAELVYQALFPEYQQ